jgi:alpha-L-arabinofuranosidase
MTFDTTITVNTNNIIGDVHAHLYGANLEHLGQSIYGGIWAEMLFDRKFFGQDRAYVGLSEGLSQQSPHFGVVIPWEAVNPNYDAVRCVHDSTTYYTGTQSQRITVISDDGQPHGIRQRGLYLEAGRAYTVRLLLLGDVSAAMVQLGDQTWQAPVTAEWATVQHTLTPSTTETNGVLTITFKGTGNLWIGCASLMPADHVNGFRPDVLAALREWGPTFLRWPGGNFVSAYHWWDAIGARDKRPSYLDPAWGLIEPNDMGTDEFIALCRLLGCEPVLTINMGNGTLAEAAAWVEYCNGAAHTRYGALRAENGHAEPYNVTTWFVGNEQFGNWQVGHVDAETYAERYLQYAQRMRDASPLDLLLIGVGVPTDLYGHWNRLVLQRAAHAMDELSVHYYSIRTEKWDHTPDIDTLYVPKVAAAHEVADMLDRTLEIIAQNAQPPLPLAFDEWNTYIGAKPPIYKERYDLGDALYTGALMNACIQRADRIKMSAVYHLINVMACYNVLPEYAWRQVPEARAGYWVKDTSADLQAPQVVKLPTTLVLELLTQHRGPQAVHCAVDCPTFSSPAKGNLPAYDAVPLVDAATTYDVASGYLYLSLVNRDAEQATHVALNGVQISGMVTRYTVNGAHGLSTNSAEQPDAVGSTQTTWAPTQGTLEIPAHSFSMLVIPIATA